MKAIFSTRWLALLLVGWWGLAPRAEAADKLRLLVVHGGHEFDTNQFIQVFRDNPDVTFDVVQQPAAQARWQADAAEAWDVLVLYDFWQAITDAAKADLVARLKAGKGLVVLHHAIADYQAWPEFERIIGAKYYLEKQTVNGVEKARSLWQHDVDFTVRIANNQHPVTKGLSDFQIHDETYNLFDVHPSVHALLTTEAPTSGKTIGWAKTYENARVVYLQLGHDHQAYENPNYRRLVANAIRWVGKRD